MPYRAPTHSQSQGRQQYDRRYAEQERWTSERRIYRTARWQRLRRRVLREQPWCADPYGWHRTSGLPMPAQQMDHKVPLRVAPELAYTRANLQGLCTRCHGWKTRQDLRQYPLS